MLALHIILYQPNELVMTNIIAKRLQNIKPSATIAISAKASELRSQGIDVISLAAGEPDFSPPAHVITAAKKAIDDGFHYYTARRRPCILKTSHY